MSTNRDRKAVYFDMFSGASGDMILGALLDSGLQPEELMEGLSRLDLPGYSVIIHKVRQVAIAGTLVKVAIDANVTQPHRSYADINSLIASSRLKPEVKDQALAIFKSLGEAESGIHGVSWKMSISTRSAPWIP